MYGPLMKYGPLPPRGNNEEEKTVPTDTPTLLLTRDEHRAVLRLWEFSRILRAAGLLDDADVGYFFEKPWKWEREHAIWQARGCPDLDGDACAFDAFAAAAQEEGQ